MTKTVKQACEQLGLELGIAVNADARCQQLEALCRKLVEACEGAKDQIEFCCRPDEGLGPFTLIHTFLKDVVAEAKKLEIEP